MRRRQEWRASSSAPSASETPCTWCSRAPGSGSLCLSQTRGCGAGGPAPPWPVVFDIRIYDFSNVGLTCTCSFGPSAACPFSHSCAHLQGSSPAGDWARDEGDRPVDFSSVSPGRVRQLGTPTISACGTTCSGMQSRAPWCARAACARGRSPPNTSCTPVASRERPRIALARQWTRRKRPDHRSGRCGAGAGQADVVGLRDE